MCDVFFDGLGIPAPAHRLGMSGGSHEALTGATLQALEPLMEHDAPDACILQFGGGVMFDVALYYALRAGKRKASTSTASFGGGHLGLGERRTSPTTVTPTRYRARPTGCGRRASGHPAPLPANQRRAGVPQDAVCTGAFH